LRPSFRTGPFIAQAKLRCTFRASTWLGSRLYGHLNEAGFRKVVLVLLASGVALIV
jgi:hypothetical protein